MVMIGVASANYPELMRKCHLINAPWLFNTVWWVIKGWLATRTIEKISVLGSSFLPSLEADFSLEDLPAEVGGQSDRKVSAPFPFDLSEGGLLHSPSRSGGAAAAQAGTLSSERDSSTSA